MRMYGLAIVITLVLCGVSVAHADLRPFTAVCTEGETHRYDGGNGLDIVGEKVEDTEHGWMTESWGGLKLTWPGGDKIFSHVGDRSIPYMVIAREGSTIMAVLASSAGALNLYSLIIDPILREAVYSQVSSVHIGEHRSIKGRVQNLRCKVSWVEP